MHPNQCNIKPT